MKNNNMPIEQNSGKRSLWKKILAVLVILFGIFIGGMGSVYISLCGIYRCSNLESFTALTLPFLTLFITIPIAKRINPEMEFSKTILFSLAAILSLPFVAWLLINVIDII